MVEVYYVEEYDFFVLLLVFEYVEGCVFEGFDELFLEGEVELL